MKQYPYEDAFLSPEERAKDLLSRLNVEEKVRQITCTIFAPVKAMDQQDLEDGTGSFTVLGSQNTAKDIRRAQEYVIAHSRHHIPALVHAEALNGPASLPSANLFPTSLGLAATFDPDIVKKMSEDSRKQMYAYGIRHALSPVADVARDLRWGRCNEGYGEDPTLSAEMTVAFIKGLQGENLKKGVACTGKHFLGYSQSESGLNSHKAMASRRELREIFAKPFEAAIHKADLKCVMNCYSEVDGAPMCANKEYLTGMLRDSMKFKGLVVSDYDSVRHLVSDFKMADSMLEAAKMSLEAGLDVELPTRMGYNDEFCEAVKRGEVSMDRLDEAVFRMLTLKFELGLFEDPYPHDELISEAMDNSVNNRYSLKAAAESITLMKNTGILPIRDTDKKIALIGPTGDCLRLLIGHYTYVANLEMLMLMAQGGGEVQPGLNPDEIMTEEQKKEHNQLDEIASVLSTSNVSEKKLLDPVIRQMYPDMKTIKEALSEIYPNFIYAEGCNYKGGESHFEEAVEAAMNADIVILAIGGKNGLGGTCTTGEGVDSSSLDMMGMQEVLMRKVYAANPNMVIVHTDGRPLCSEWAYANVPAIIEAWLPAVYGAQAIADVICGRISPAGRTAVTVPRDAGHLPIYYYQNNGSSASHDRGLMETGYINSESSELVPFGWGLSYTSFAYTDFQVRQDGRRITCEVCVTNTGNMDGDEVVQLYGRDDIASVVRPRVQLIGFKRIFIPSGQSRRVQFSFDLDFFAFEDWSYRWILEKGTFSLYVGSNSDDERCNASVTQEETISVEPTDRCFYADAELI